MNPPARLLALLSLLSLLSPAILRTAPGPAPSPVLGGGILSVGPVPHQVREQFELDPWYQKFTRRGRLPIVGSAGVSDEALEEASWIVGHMLEGRADLLAALADNRVRLTVMAWNEFTTDVPEHRTLDPKVYWDRRARGLGATPARPAVSCAEENLLGFPGDPYAKENILVHEFAHAIHEMGLVKTDPTFEGRLKASYEAAMARGLWKSTYAAVNRQEYWAEGVQSWFDDNRENDSLHNHVNTRAELKEYDSALAGLCAEVFGDRAWRYVRPARRPAADRAHLAGRPPAAAPQFRWREAPLVDYPRVTLDTVLGEIELELDARHAPVSTTNFLRYVLLGLYQDGAFHRTVTPSNQPDNPVKIEVVQASANPARTNELAPPIPLERTSVTGLKHRDGTLSMARAEPDSAQDHFFICLGDQPELDYGGKRNRDGQGFAAFGRVVRGMEVVRKIQLAPADGQVLTPRIVIQRATRVR